jgi:hypothetical protein
MKVVIEIENSEEWKVIQDSLLVLQSTRSSQKHTSSPSIIQKGNKKLNPEILFGLWADSPVKLPELRKKIWKRKF